MTTQKGALAPGFLAQRMERLVVPATIAMAQRARGLRAKGEKVLSLALGEPDFATPPAVIEAAHRAALEGQTKYPPVDGTPALKAAIARKFARENALDYAPAEIMVSNGGKQVIFNAFMATVQPGDEVVIPRPYWVSYPLIVQMFGGTPVYADCHEADDFRLTASALEAAITPRTKCLCSTSPTILPAGPWGRWIWRRWPRCCAVTRMCTYYLTRYTNTCCMMTCVMSRWRRWRLI